MQSPSSQRLNKPVVASFFCPFSKKPMGRVTREAASSLQDNTSEPGRLERDWQSEQEGSAAVGHEAVVFRGGAVVFYLQGSSSLCSVWRGRQCQSRCPFSRLWGSWWSLRLLRLKLGVELLLRCWKRSGSRENSWDKRSKETWSQLRKRGSR